MISQRARELRSADQVLWEIVASLKDDAWLTPERLVEELAKGHELTGKGSAWKQLRRLIQAKADAYVVPAHAVLYPVVYIMDEHSRWWHKGDKRHELYEEADSWRFTNLMW